MMNKTFPAQIDALSDVLGFVDLTLEGCGCPMKIQMAICVAIEEVFVNVARYAYGGGEGYVVLGIGFAFLQQWLGFIKMPGHFIVQAYPIVVSWIDVLLVTGGVATIGYLIALLPVSILSKR